MPLRVTEMRMPLDGDERALAQRALQHAGLEASDVSSIELVRQSVDKRRRPPVFVCTFDLHLAPHAKAPKRFPRGRKVRFVETPVYSSPQSGDQPLEHRPVVIGAGPAGLFAALVLARAGYRPRVIERGSRMNHRVGQIERFHRENGLLLESNYLFGEGGAGTFSDGKLTSRGKDPRVAMVLEEFRTKSGYDLVGYFYRPHLGSDRVRAVVGRLRREVEELGGEFLYDTRVDRILRRNGQVERLETSVGDVPAQAVILAPGHSARDLYRSLQRDEFRLEQKPFQLGFRIEHPQTYVDEVIYSKASVAKRMGPADYRLVAQVEGRGVYSFCMCPGGEIIPAIHDHEHYNTNGMSYSKKDTGFANSGVVTTLEPSEFGSDDPLAGILYQERYEKIAAEKSGAGFELPTQRLLDFMDQKPSKDVPDTSCRSGQRPVVMDELAAPWLTDLIRQGLFAFDRQMPGYLSPEAIICGPEMRSSAPVRILRDPVDLQAKDACGLYPVGEGAGYAGGIVSAAVDGWRAAEALISRYCGPKEQRIA
ncbi:MAG: FAD-dependent oxidoreductase [Planctomycetota bacterium]